MRAKSWWWMLAALLPVLGKTQNADAPSAPRGLQYHAVVIGISDYADRGAAGWHDLNTAADDAKAVGDVLEKAYGFKVTRLMDAAATRAAVVAALDQISLLGPNDAALVYFAGHGNYSQRTHEGYWIPCDARASDGNRKPVEDWIWNSTLTRVIDASQARHILVVSDSCFSGSLFRGASSEPDFAAFRPAAGDPATDPKYQYYRRALQLPARQLLTSGSLEPVPDGGAVHSMFAQQILHFLNDPARRVFSASELGVTICPRVSSLTGTMPRFGTFDVGSHGGGDFVFTRAGVDLPVGDAPELVASRSRAGNPGDALLLDEQGWGQGARLLAGQTLAAPAGGKETPVPGEIAELLRDLDNDHKARKVVSPADPPPPGAWVLLPFKVTAEEVEPAARAAALFRERLARALRAGGAEVLNRADLADILREHRLSTTDLADPARKLEVGRLLPAANLVSAEVIPDGERLMVFLSVTDTATSAVRLLDEVEMGKADLPGTVLKLKAGD